MKVYVITCGEYSDYQICAVTLDKKQAELLKARYSDESDEAYIEEYETDNYKIEADDAYKHMYMVKFNNKSEISSCTPVSFQWHDHGDVNWGFDNIISIFVKEKDEEHARKIAKDMYAKCMAELNNL